MGLAVMILGLVLFLGVHTLPAQGELRTRAIAVMGEGSSFTRLSPCSGSC